MTGSNVSFASNVNIITSNPERMRNGDPAFFKKISDFYALRKLYTMCGGSTNSKMYQFAYWQKEILCGEQGFSVRGKILRLENEMKLWTRNMVIKKWMQTRFFL